ASTRRHTRSTRDWSSDVCSSDLAARKTAFHHANAAFHAGRGATMLGDRALLQGQHAEVEGDRIEPARKDDARAAASGGFMMRVRSEERRVGKEGSYGGCGVEE